MTSINSLTILAFLGSIKCGIAMAQETPTMHSNCITAFILLVFKFFCPGSWLVTTNQEPGQKNLNTSNMKAVIQLLCLVGVSWAMAMPHLIEPKNAKMVNKLMDVIESGLDTPKAGEGRALFISLTLTSTMTNLDTTTVTSTVTPSCVAGTFTECTATTTTTTTTSTTTTTTTTTVAPGRRKRAAGSKEEFLEVIHDITQGAKVVLMVL